jgi:hypothetical protein
MSVMEFFRGIPQVIHYTYYGWIRAMLLLNVEAYIYLAKHNTDEK